MYPIYSVEKSAMSIVDPYMDYNSPEGEAVRKSAFRTFMGLSNEYSRLYEENLQLKGSLVQVSTQDSFASAEIIVRVSYRDALCPERAVAIAKDLLDKYVIEHAKR